ncbi:alpha/beta hydrolase family protein [Dyella sp. 20L07]|uniref:alpha/beta hydrolase family protein n=1 Tax=Dyella sp. 20L07 TaxID=3384240 RepID=UPI003D26E4CC
MSALISNSTALPAYETLPAVTVDGARADVLLQRPAGDTRAVLYWLPALGVSARQYLPLAQALAEKGIAVAIHEWRGIGSSNHRASRRDNWGYRELLKDDLPAGLGALQKLLPRARYWLGGHSLGAQLASVYAGLNPGQVAGLVVVASGSPYWRRFRYALLVRLAYALAPLLAGVVGYLPGRRIGFGGNEARQVITDWALTGTTGRYAAAGIADDLEQRLGALDLPLLALRMHDDWLGPQASLDWLLGKMPHNYVQRDVLTSADFDDKPADHFGWMKMPEPVASRIASWLSASVSDTAVP